MDAMRRWRIDHVPHVQGDSTMMPYHPIIWPETIAVSRMLFVTRQRETKDNRPVFKFKELRILEKRKMSKRSIKGKRMLIF